MVDKKVSKQEIVEERIEEPEKTIHKLHDPEVKNIFVSKEYYRKEKKLIIYPSRRQGDERVPKYKNIKKVILE
ncbi:hypothetical protein GF352_04990, partial [archaeon]|nr:hypothetical protein [archaeon]